MLSPLFLSRLHKGKGAKDAIEVAKRHE